MRNLRVAHGVSGSGHEAVVSADELPAIRVADDHKSDPVDFGGGMPLVIAGGRLAGGHNDRPPVVLDLVEAE
jgi:hypothetical protein